MLCQNTICSLFQNHSKKTSNNLASKHIIIVGVGRSGTSLLQSMLASHSDVDFLPETGFIRRYWIPKKFSRFVHSGNYKKIVRLVRLDKRLSRFSINVENALSFVANSCVDGELESALYKRICMHELKNENNFIGDKDPKLIEYHSFISQNLKNSNVIHIIRDPRDVLLSKKNAEWSKHRHVWLHIFAWRVQLELGLKYARDINLRYFELRYENLITSPEDILLALCDFLGVNYQKSMLNFPQNSRHFVAPEEFGWKKEVLQPLNQSNLNKWEKFLPDKEIVLIEKFCSHLMKIHGYNRARKFSSLSFKDKIWVMIGYIFMASILLPYKCFRKGNYR